MTKDNVTVKAGSLTGTSIAAVRVATGKAQVSLNLSTADASKNTVNGPVKATVDWRKRCCNRHDRWRPAADQHYR